MSQKSHRQSKTIHFNGIVKHPVSAKILGWILLSCFSTMLIGAGLSKDIDLMILAAVFVFVSIILILHFNVERLTFDDNGFTYRNFLGFSQRYDYSQIIKVQEKKTYSRFEDRSLNDIIITTDKRKISLQGNMDHIEDFKICLSFKCQSVIDKTILP